MPPSATRWALALAFVGGLVGGVATSAVLAAGGAFIQATVWPRAPWRAAVLVLAGWAAGTGVAVLLNFVGEARGLEVPTRLGSGLTVLGVYASATAGTALAWVASRLEHHS